MSTAKRIEIPGVERITAERNRQMDIEGWTPEHDSIHRDGALADAAVCYASLAAFQASHGKVDCDVMPLRWPFACGWWKPSENPVRNLEKAGALIAAEIDRIQAKEQS